jgi:hypothetical protein
VHLLDGWRRDQFVAQTPGGGPDEQVRGGFRVEGLNEHLVAAPFDLVRRASCRDLVTGSANSMTLKWFGAVSTRITLCESDFSVSIFWALAASAMAMVKTMVFCMPKFPPIPASRQKKTA